MSVCLAGWLFACVCVCVCVCVCFCLPVSVCLSLSLSLSQSLCLCLSVCLSLCARALVCVRFFVGFNPLFSFASLLAACDMSISNGHNFRVNRLSAFWTWVTEVMSVFRSVPTDGLFEFY